MTLRWDEFKQRADELYDGRETVSESEAAAWADQNRFEPEIVDALRELPHGSYTREQLIGEASGLLSRLDTGIGRPF